MIKLKYDINMTYLHSLDNKMIVIDVIVVVGKGLI